MNNWELEKYGDSRYFLKEIECFLGLKDYSILKFRYIRRDRDVLYVLDIFISKGILVLFVLKYFCFICFKIF